MDVSDVTSPEGDWSSLLVGLARLYPPKWYIKGTLERSCGNEKG